MGIITQPLLLTSLLLIVSNVFVPFAVLYMNQPLKLDYVYATACLLGAVYFNFRGACGIEKSVREPQRAASVILR